MTLRSFAQKLYPVTTVLTVYILLTSCSAVTIDNDAPPEEQYAEGERLLKKDRFLEAVERFRILRNRHPYSKYAALATLRIGDSHFQEEAFLEAASAYKIFRELYPKHEQSGYALFRVGESHYNMLPSTTDRDLDPAQEAIDAYTNYLKDFPSGPYAAEANKKVGELRGKLAEKETYIGDFYYKRELYQAAASRYGYLLQKYPEFGKNKETLFRLAFSFEKIGDFRRAEKALSALERDFPEELKTSDAQELKQKVTNGLAENPQ